MYIVVFDLGNRTTRWVVKSEGTRRKWDDGCYI